MNLSRFVEAAETFSNLLEGHYGLVSPGRLPAVQEQHDRAVSHLARLTLRLLEPVSAELRIDGAIRGELRAGEPRSLRLEPSSHHLAIEASGRSPFSMDLRLRRGEERIVSVSLELPVEATSADPPPPMIESPILWIIIGVAVALTAAGIGVAIWWEGGGRLSDPIFGDAAT